VNTTDEAFIVAWYAIDNNNYMFRPSGGNHQVFTSLKRKHQAICYIYFGAEILDRLRRLIGNLPIKLHVSAIRWPSSGFYKFEEKRPSDMLHLLWC
jgi:hypothetical protein